MKSNSVFIFRFLLSMVFAIVIISCGPSREERRQQEIEDSIRLDQDRRILLERASEMIQQSTQNQEETAESPVEEDPDDK